MTGTRQASEQWRFAQAALLRMANESVEPTPDNFAIYYTVVSRADADFVEEFERAMTAHGAMSKEALSTLSSILKPRDPSSSASASVATKAASGILLTVDEHQRATANFTERLDVAINKVRIDVNDPEKLLATVAALEADRNALVESNARLQTQISHHRTQIGDLERQMLNEQRRAQVDKLTGLGNRAQFDGDIERLFADRSKPVSLIMIDIDHFKSINDSIGHQGGDHAIRTVAQRIRAALRPGDLVSRYGGEEFAVLLPGCSLTAAHTVAERIRASVGGNYVEFPDRNALSLKITASLGVADRGPADTITTLIDLADARLYAAKRSGRNRTVANGRGHPREAPTMPVAQIRLPEPEPDAEPISMGMR